MVSPELIQLVRDAGARRRRPTPIEAMRSALAGVVDTGCLADDDVRTLYAAYRASMNADVVTP